MARPSPGHNCRSDFDIRGESSAATRSSAGKGSTLESRRSRYRPPETACLTVMRSESQRAELGRTGEGWNVFERYVIARHAIFCVIVVLLYLLLNRPEVIMLSKLGYSVWYPATGLVLAVMVGISPWYLPLAVLAGALAGVAIYHQPLLSWSGLVTPLLGSGSYAVAAYLLRGPLKIDLALRRRRDVVRYISVTLGAAVFATVSGTACLAADGTIPWAQYWRSAWAWYVGDVVGLVGFAPFLLIHLFPGVLRTLSPSSAAATHKGRHATAT